MPVSHTISVVLTHFNKGMLLKRAIASLQPQANQTSETAELLEIIVVDDASTDPAWPAFSQELQQEFSHLKIIQNTKNQGPARCLNQGANAARGDYLFFMDGDDVLAPNRLLQIVALMQAKQCDLFYGNKVKVHHESKALEYPTLETNCIDSPLTYMIEHNIMEMCVMCTQQTWQKSAGCNSNLFIQDESLALELGLVATRLLFSETPTVFVILDARETKRVRGDNRLSQNLNQQHHDMFFTIKDFIEQRPVNEAQTSMLLRKVFSTYWKSLKARNLQSIVEFIRYVLAKRRPAKWWINRQSELVHYFEALDHVRRPSSNEY